MNDLSLIQHVDEALSNPARYARPAFEMSDVMKLWRSNRSNTNPLMYQPGDFCDENPFAWQNERRATPKPLDDENISALKRWTQAAAEMEKIYETQVFVVPHVGALGDSLADEDMSTMTTCLSIARLHKKCFEGTMSENEGYSMLKWIVDSIGSSCLNRSNGNEPDVISKIITSPFCLRPDLFVRFILELSGSMCIDSFVNTICDLLFDTSYYLALLNDRVELFVFIINEYERVTGRNASKLINKMNAKGVLTPSCLPQICKFLRQNGF